MAIMVGWTPAICVVLSIGTFALIQTLHVNQHSTYCKTKAEWIKTLPSNLRSQIRNYD